MVIQYVGFQLKPRGREYAYRVVDMKNEAREFTLTISNQAFVDQHVPYQDAAAICYQKLQRALADEKAEEPLKKHHTISPEELEDYRQKYRPGKRRS
jgi:hypothetical protein